MVVDNLSALIRVTIFTFWYCDDHRFSCWINASIPRPRTVRCSWVYPPYPTVWFRIWLRIVYKQEHCSVPDDSSTFWGRFFTFFYRLAFSAHECTHQVDLWRKKQQTINLINRSSNYIKNLNNNARQKYKENISWMLYCIDLYIYILYDKTVSFYSYHYIM